MNRRTWTRAVVATLALLVTCLTTVTFAGWAAAATGMAGGRSATAPAAGAPTVRATGTDVAVDWVAATGPVPATAYRLERTHAETGTTVPAAGSCAGEVSSTSCTDTGVPAGTWTYRLRALLGPWTGPASPASPAVHVEGSVDASLDVAPRTVSPGDDIVVTGTGWPEGGQVAVTFGGAALCTVPADPDGALSASCTVPARSAGRYAVRATSGVRTTTSGELTVVPALRSVTPATSPGGQLSVFARGFAANSQADVWLGSRALGVRGLPQSGESPMSLSVPADLAPGEYTLRVVDTAGNEATAPVTVAAAGIQVSPASATPGDTVQVTGAGWSPSGVQVRINLPSANLCILTPDQQGTIAGSCQLPNTPGGQIQVAATDGASVAHAPLRVTSSVSSNAQITSPGATLTLSGRGFGSGSLGSVHIDGAPVSTTSPATSAANGTLVASVVVPALTTGPHELRLSDALGNTATTSVSVVAPELTLSQASGPAQGAIQVSGRHWPAGVGVVVQFDGGTACTPTSGSDGSFGPTACTVPLLAGGPHNVSARTATTVIATPLTFTVTPKAVADTRWVSPGQSATLRGNGLPANSDVRFLIAGQEVATVRTDGYGQAFKSVVVPDLPAGDAAVQVIGALGASPDATITVFRPTLQLDTTSIVPGKTVVKVTGSGWPSGQLVSLRIGSTVACSAYATGDRLDTTCVPQALPGGAGQAVTASTGQVSATAAPVTVVAAASLNVTSAAPGSTVYPVARGLIAGRAVDFVVNGTVVETRTAPSDGTWQRGFLIPAGTPPGPLVFEFRQQDAPPVSVTLTVTG